MRLIDADALVQMPWVLPNRMTRETALECFKHIVSEAPTIDAEPVRHGRWEYQWFDSVCSVCGYINRCDPITRCRNDTRYCPKCGAKMDGGAQE